MNSGYEIFISYRRQFSLSDATLIYYRLKTSHARKVFLDTREIDYGDWESLILKTISATPHFILLLKRNTLKNCDDPDDILCKEIEKAIDTKRNIVPIIYEDFKIKDLKKGKYTNNQKIIDTIAKSQGWPMYNIYFPEILGKLNKTVFVPSAQIKIENLLSEDIKQTAKITDSTTDFSESLYSSSDSDDYFSTVYSHNVILPKSFSLIVPKIDVSDVNIEYLPPTPLSEDDNDVLKVDYHPGSDNPSEIWVRLLVKNLEDADITNCSVQLLGLYDEKTHEPIIAVPDPITLGWEYNQPKTVEGSTIIPRGGSVHADIAYSLSDANKFVIASFNKQIQHIGIGDYSMELQILGSVKDVPKNPKKFMINIDYFGNQDLYLGMWNQSKQ